MTFDWTLYRGGVKWLRERTIYMSKFPKTQAVLDGVAAIIGFGHSAPNAPETVRVLSELEDSDEEALREDWARVGDDLYHAAEKLTNT